MCDEPLGIFSDEVQGFANRDRNGCCGGKSRKIGLVISGGSVGNVVSKLMVSRVVGVGFNVVNVIEVIVVGKRGMRYGSVHVVLFVSVISFEGVNADFTIRVDVRRVVVEVVTKNSGK